MKRMLPILCVLLLLTGRVFAQWSGSLLPVISETNHSGSVVMNAEEVLTDSGNHPIGWFTGASVRIAPKTGKGMVVKSMINVEAAAQLQLMIDDRKAPAGARFWIEHGQTKVPVNFYSELGGWYGDLGPTNKLPTGLIPVKLWVEIPAGFRGRLAIGPLVLKGGKPGKDRAATILNINVVDLENEPKTTAELIDTLTELQGFTVSGAKRAVAGGFVPAKFRPALGDPELNEGAGDPDPMPENPPAEDPAEAAARAAMGAKPTEKEVQKPVTRKRPSYQAPAGKKVVYEGQGYVLLSGSDSQGNPRLWAVVTEEDVKVVLVVRGTA